jgi:hypothetical protein
MPQGYTRAGSKERPPKFTALQVPGVDERKTFPIHVPSTPPLLDETTSYDDW